MSNYEKRVNEIKSQLSEELGEDVFVLTEALQGEKEVVPFLNSNAKEIGTDWRDRGKIMMFLRLVNIHSGKVEFVKELGKAFSSSTYINFCDEVVRLGF